MASLDELLYDLRRVEGHRADLTDKRIKSIYSSLMKDLTSFLSDEYIKYADKDGHLYLSYLNSQNKRARFLQEIVARVENITPALRKEMLDMVDMTYEKSYRGIVKAVLNADETQPLDLPSTLVRPEVLRKAVKNNIEKLTLPVVMDKHRAEIIADIQQTLNVGLMNGDRYETMTKRIQERLGVSYSKASNIVRTESHRNIESGIMDGAKETASIIEKDGDLIYAATWKTMKDQRVRPQQRRRKKGKWITTISNNGANHQKMEGVTIKVGEQFQLEKDVFAECPGMSGTARNDCRCRCYLSYSLMTVEEFAKATKQTPEEVRKKYKMPVKEKDLTNSENSDIIPSGNPETERPQLKMSDYPEQFTKGAEGKNTQKLIDYVNSIEGADPNALRLYASMGRLENISSNGIPFKISHGKTHAVSYKYSGATHELKEVKINYPKLTGDNFAGQVNTTLHEQMHLLDMFGRKDVHKYNGWFSSSTQSLVDAFQSTSADIGEEIAELFGKHNVEYHAIRDRLKKEYDRRIADVKEKYLPNGMSPWEDMRAYRLYEKEAKKLRNEMIAQTDYESRNIMGGGICSLQDIYDALSGGRYRANGTVIYGHGTKYYARIFSRIEEVIANYASLSVTRPDLIKMLRKDKPKLCAELDKLIKDLADKAGE